MKLSNRDLPLYVKNRRPGYELTAYGAVSYAPAGYYGTERLNARLRALYYAQNGTPTIYSYGTPIAWWDATHQTWIVPDVSYSMTTAKHQSYLRQLDPVIIPADCGSGDEYEAFASGRSIYTRGKVQAA